MQTRKRWLNIRLIAVMSLLTGLAGADSVGICTSKDASDLERLASQEVGRYVYLRTGELLGKSGQHGTIVVAQNNSSAITDEAVRTASRDLQAQQYVLKTTTSGNKKTWWIVGGDDIGTLYGAYRFAEKLGVRFYLHGDVIPDERLTVIPEMEDTGKPLFKLRGVNPWGSHPFGFDAWSAEDYKAIFTQLTKLRMNFLGIHCYPEGHPYAEPTVWVGTTNDFDAKGQVTFSYPALYYSTVFKPGWGGYLPKKTSDYSFGGALLFADDAWAPEVMRGYCPVPEPLDACNEVFNRMAAQFRDAFGFARELGIKTCIGTESPLTLPKAVRERLKSQGKKPDDPAMVKEVYEGMFRRIGASHPLDYFWLWTPEGWTWSGNKPEQYTNTVRDVKLAIEALNHSGAPFKLATCGWVLGPQHDRAAFDADLPKEIPMSAISRKTGATPVDPAFKNISGRDTWAIPWLESDDREGLAGVQLFVGRMRRDAADALGYGCTGLMGLHWRTDILSPNVGALAEAAWDQSGWNPTRITRSEDPVTRIEGGHGGNLAAYPNARIGNTREPTPYQTCRYGLDGYDLKLPNGHYRVTLKFCEPHFDSAGKRIGDFKLQGKHVIEALDIFARVGKFAALDLSFDDIEVTNGWLHLEITGRQSLPCISALVAEGTTVTRKINFGGPVYQDYEADTQPGANSTQKPYMACDDFYADWARAHFGIEEIGKVFAKIDGKVPKLSDGSCPSGRLTPIVKPWNELLPGFAFIHELEAFRSHIKGAGNLDRFDYWLNTFRYLKAIAEVRCALAKPEPLELTRLYTEAYHALLRSVRTPGGLAMVVNMENNPGWFSTVTKEASQPWSKTYTLEPRILVPTLRSSVRKDEALRLTFIVLMQQSPAEVTVLWRPLGTGDFRKMPAHLQARATYQVTLPRSETSYEYRIEAQTADGKTVLWPATAPEMNQTVVIW